MKVLDLFSGLRGWSEPWKERGHEVFTIDWDKRFDADLYIDVLKLKPQDFPWKPDVILASPPCQSFSTMTMGSNWSYDGKPTNATAAKRLKLVDRTVSIIHWANPTAFLVENPRARLRTLETRLDEFERRTVTYCHYGERYMKVTDLWGGFPAGLELRPICHNQRGHALDCCCWDHISAPRGSYTGVQGRDSALAAKIPRQLAVDVMGAILDALA